MDAHSKSAAIATSGPYHGWLVVAAAFLVALFGWGLGFYGVGIYLVALQAVAMAILMTTSAPALLIIGCVLFGLGLGNLVSLPALIVQQEFPAPHFARVVSMVVAINQFAFAFGPALLGRLQQPDGSYSRALFACLLMQVIGAIIMLAPVVVRMNRAR